MKGLKLKEMKRSERIKFELLDAMKYHVGCRGNKVIYAFPPNTNPVIKEDIKVTQIAGGKGNLTFLGNLHFIKGNKKPFKFSGTTEYTSYVCEKGFLIMQF